jgi:hypothetical protein
VSDFLTRLRLPLMYDTNISAVTANINIANRDRYQAADEIERLRREVQYLRHYGNKDCTHMADEAMKRGDMDSTADEATVALSK